LDVDLLAGNSNSTVTRERERERERERGRDLLARALLQEVVPGLFSQKSH